VKNRWSLCVKNFGKIESAEIEVSPLMIFIGDNNSGKSYLMSLLWGIINKSYTLLKDEECFNTDSYLKCEKWLETVKTDEQIIINHQVKLMLVDWVNEIFTIKKDSLIKSIYNKDINIEEIKIALIEGEDFQVNIDKIHVTIFIDELGKINDKKYKRRMDLSNLCYYLLFDSFKQVSNSVEEPLFLPASRTGFMLTYKTLINESLKSSFGNDNIQKSRFTEPIINFLRKFVNLDLGINNEYFKIVRFIEMELLKGNIVKDESPVKNIYYKPNNLNDNLPLYLTSSLVTEVAPLVLFLSDVNSNFKTLIIEEPEAHLHLKAQIAMARVVVRLINSGLNVWITTHSDTFMQQINNLMKVNVHKNKEEILRQLDLEEEDCLDISKVKIYEFNTNIDKTTVTSIKNSETGFPLPTFNNIINKLMDEVMILEDDEND
jgi:predicted ATPase